MKHGDPFPRRDASAPPSAEGHTGTIASLIQGQLPSAAADALRRIGDLAAARGEAAYLVGGPVRDLLLGRPHADLDVVVEGDGIALAESAATTLDANVVRRHDRFGTATIALSEGIHLDVATTRRETYPRPAALPVVERGTLADDLRRRDFTINAIAASLRPGEFGALRDAYGGVADVSGRRIRVLHAGSFVDDPTRIFRAVRLSERLSFEVEKRTEEALRECVKAGWVAALSGARVRNEVLLTLEEESPAAVFLRLEAWGVLERLPAPFPRGPSADRLEAATVLCRAWGDLVPSFRRQKALLFAWLGVLEETPARETAQWLRLDRGLLARLALVVARRSRVRDALRRAETQPSAWHDLLADVDAEGLVALAAEHDRAAWNRLLEAWRAARQATPWVRGDDLRAMGFPPGPLYQDVLQATFRAQLDGCVAERAEALDYARREMERLLAEAHAGPASGLL
jgi:tRNA nucleotidyltransferase (CCA-adding enzyme)